MFLNNTAWAGGALGIDSPQNACLILNSSFVNNSATRYSEEMDALPLRSSVGHGGAVAATLQNEFNIINVSFVDNTATTGGAVLWG